VHPTHDAAVLLGVSVWTVRTVRTGALRAPCADVRAGGRERPADAGCVSATHDVDAPTGSRWRA
jgi:hypothetical protein